MGFSNKRYLKPDGIKKFEEPRNLPNNGDNVCGILGIEMV